MGISAHKLKTCGLICKKIMKQILSQKDLDDALCSSRSGSIDCCIKTNSNALDKIFTIEEYGINYMISKDDVITDIIFWLMDSFIGEAIKNGNLYMLE